jgi:polyisoprenoid-binding protein YceI
MPHGVHKAATHDPADAPAGVYAIDPSHASIILRVMHEGRSYSTFRFGSVQGAVDWNPAQPEASKVDVTVDTKSIMTPVPGFIDNLTGSEFLNSAMFPQARFVSTGIRRTGPTTGEITGDLTLLGQTHPITVQAQMLGIGSNPRHLTTIGFEGTAKFKRSAYGMIGEIPNIADEVELQLDFEVDLKKG